MSSTFIDFVPSTVAAPQFQATFAGTPYNVSITWNVFGQDYYINVTDLSGNLILCRSMTSSGGTLQALVNWAAPGVATITANQNHNVPIGTLVNIEISGTNTILDGEWQALATGPTTLTYAANNPNVLLPINASLEFPLNLIGSYIPGAFLLFHEDTQQFEYE